MTGKEKRKIEKRVLILSLGFLGLAVVFLILAGICGFIQTPLYPVGLAMILLGYWLVSDVFSIIWTNGFEGKSEEQKRAYYIYAGLDAAGFAGLIWFMVNVESTTGIAIYVASLLLKRKFRNQFEEKPQDEDTDLEQEVCVTDEKDSSDEKLPQMADTRTNINTADEADTDFLTDVKAKRSVQETEVSKGTVTLEELMHMDENE